MTVIYLCSAFIIGGFCAWLMSTRKIKLAALDIPNERSSHQSPTPKNGGIGIWLTIIAGIILLLSNYLLAGVIFLLGVLSLSDDFVKIPIKLRLLSHIFLALIAILIIFGKPTIIALPLFVFWIIFIAGSANIYNFMDGIHGLSGLTGVVGFALLAAFAYFFKHNETIGLLSLMISVACLGYLPFNFPRAKVFMGEVGSVILGFTFALFVFILTKSVSDFVCIGALLSTFYLDAIVTMVVRLKSRENLLVAHRKHLYQLLVNEKGISHWKISSVYALTQLIIGGIFIALWQIQIPVVRGVLMAVAVIVILFVAILLNKTIRNKAQGISA